MSQTETENTQNSRIHQKINLWKWWKRKNTGIHPDTPYDKGFFCVCLSPSTHTKTIYRWSLSVCSMNTCWNTKDSHLNATFTHSTEDGNICIRKTNSLPSLSLCSFNLPWKTHSESYLSNMILTIPAMVDGNYITTPLSVTCSVPLECVLCSVIIFNLYAPRFIAMLPVHKASPFCPTLWWASLPHLEDFKMMDIIHLSYVDTAMCSVFLAKLLSLALRQHEHDTNPAWRK